MAKRLSKTLWYGTDVDATGQPLLPPATTNPGDLDGLHKGELFMHLAEDEVTLWGVSSNGKVVKITGKSDEANIDLSDYLKKEVWDSVWEIRQDTSGQKYIYGKLPVVTQYGITMYADNGSLDIPSIYAGLPIDNNTLVRDTNGVLMINPNLDLGGGGGASSWDELEGVPSWIGATKPTYEYSEIQNTPDLSKYISSDDLSKYVTLGTEQTITGKKNFTTGGLFVNGKQIQYDATNGCWKLEGNLLVTGGVTMYADGTTSGGSSAYSTLGSLSNVDDSIDASASVDRVLFQAAGSSEWVTKPLSEIGGSVSGDYLPLSGGTLTGKLTIGLASAVPLVLQNTSATNSYIDFKANGWSTTKTGSVGIIREPYLGNEVALLACGDPRILVSEKGGIYYQEGYNTETFPILHAGNISSYNAGSATKLQTARKIWGQSFDGSGNVDGVFITNASVNYPIRIQQNYNNTWTSAILATNSALKAGQHYNIDFGYSPNAYNSAWIGYYHAGVGSTSNRLSMGLNAVDDVVNILATGYVGIGTTSPSEKLHVIGNIYAQASSTTNPYASINFAWSSTELWQISGRFHRSTASDSGRLKTYHYDGSSWLAVMTLLKGGDMLVAGGITMYSDIRKKTILNHVELSLKQIADAPLILHYYNSDQDKTTHVGSIAQYWAGLNDWFCKKDEEGFYTMEIQNAALASTISIARHLERYENKTDKKIRQLKKRISQLETELNILKNEGRYLC